MDVTWKTVRTSKCTLHDSYLFLCLSVVNAYKTLPVYKQTNKQRCTLKTINIDKLTWECLVNTFFIFYPKLSMIYNHILRQWKPRSKISPTAKRHKGLGIRGISLQRTGYKGTETAFLGLPPGTQNSLSPKQKEDGKCWKQIC